MKKVDKVFTYMASKYCSWWQKRVETPALEKEERERWGQALSPFTSRQINQGLQICRKHYGYRPPYAQEFVELINKQMRRPVDPFNRKVRVDPPVVTKRSRQFFSDAKRMLSEESEGLND